jgi:hypothetical protein
MGQFIRQDPLVSLVRCVAKCLDVPQVALPASCRPPVAETDGVNYLAGCFALNYMPERHTCLHTHT